jgi:hypothetical protein
MTHRFSSPEIARFVAPAAVLLTGFLLQPTPTAARPDYTRRTKQECNYCHPPGGYNLNDAGHYFEKNRSLNGYKPPDAPKKGDDQKSAKADDGKSRSK